MFEAECQILPVESDSIVVKVIAANKKLAKANVAREMLEILQNGLTASDGRAFCFPHLSDERLVIHIFKFYSATPRSCVSEVDGDHNVFWLLFGFRNRSR